MIHVVEGSARSGAAPSDVVVRVARAGERARSSRPSPASAPEARVTVAVADPRLGEAIAQAIARAVREALPPPPPQLPVVRFRTTKRLAAVTPRLEGALAVVRVTAGNARRICGFLDAARAAGAAGVQLVWDGITPERDRVEAPIFAALEAARATPTGMPVVLARTAAPTLALRLLATARRGEGTIR